MVVVVFGHEVQVVRNRHGRSHARMWNRGIWRWVQHLSARQKGFPGSAKVRENLLERTRIVVRVVRLAVCQVGGRELVVVRQVVVEACQPEWLDIEQVAGVLLCGPLPIRPRSQLCAGAGASHFLQPRRRAAKPREDDRQQPGRIGIERSVEPGWRLSHVVKGDSAMGGDAWPRMHRMIGVRPRWLPVAEKTLTVKIVPNAKVSKRRARDPHRVVVVVYDGLCTFEFGIVVEMFGLARPEFDQWYSFSVCGLARRTVRATGGITVTPRGDLRELERADTIIIPGWPKPIAAPPRRLVQALLRAHERGARLVSICVGSFVLAATGLLNDRSATTHWRFADQMARDFPRVRLEPDVLYVDEGDLLTSAGSAAGIDLCLHIIRKDFGTEVANAVARRAVVSPHREGGQAQFIDMPVGEAANPWLSTLLHWVNARLDKRITIDQLADAAHVSPRTLTRRFASTTGTSPHQWITGLRVRRAKDLLETTTLSIEEVADASGFGSAALLRHHFHASVKVSPSSYRRLFRRKSERLRRA